MSRRRSGLARESALLRVCRATSQAAGAAAGRQGRGIPGACGAHRAHACQGLPWCNSTRGREASARPAHQLRLDCTAHPTAARRRRRPKPSCLRPELLAHATVPSVMGHAGLQGVAAVLRCAFHSFRRRCSRSFSAAAARRTTVVTTRRHSSVVPDRRRGRRSRAAAQRASARTQGQKQQEGAPCA